MNSSFKKTAIASVIAGTFAAAAIPAAYLGEVGGWRGVRQHLKTKFRDTGVIYGC